VTTEVTTSLAISVNVSICLLLYKKRGEGGLVFQDRYRLDRLALTKKFLQRRNWWFFWKKISGPI